MLNKKRLTLEKIGKLLSKLAEKSENVYWLSSPEMDKIVYISPAFEKIWGRPREAILSKPELWITYVHPEDAKNHHPIHTMAEHVAKDGEDARFDETFRIIRPDGEIRWIIDRGFPIYEDGECCGVTGVAVDITREKYAEVELREAKERAELANRAKSEFLASMSHDLRTPLSGIVSMTRLLQTRNKDESQEKLFDLVVQGSETLLRLIEELLDYSRLEAGKLPMHREAFDLRRLAEEVINIMAPEANHKQLQLMINYNDFVTRHVIGDPHRMRRILMNLLGNAMKFTEKGHVIISVEEIFTTSSHARLQLSVEDTGIGIAPDKLDSVFDRFSKIEPSYRGRYKGTGLGLAIVKQLVESMEGEVGIHSQLGKGSTFWCSLPFEKQNVQSKTSIWQRHYSDVRILIVDDHLTRAKLLQKQIATPNVQIVTNEDAIDVLTAAANENTPYQIIIIDNESGKPKTALNLATNINKTLTLKNPMLLLATKPITDRKLASIKKHGFFDYLIKPIHPTELVQSLAKDWGLWMTDKISKTQQVKDFSANILLVDDEPLSQTVITILLTEELGCDIDIASNGQQAIELAKAHDYDLILMDIGLPDQDGFSVAKTIRQYEDSHNPTLIIALTAHASEEIKSKCFETGMDGHLTKPASVEDLQDLIQRVILNSIESLAPAPTHQHATKQPTKKHDTALT